LIHEERSGTPCQTRTYDHETEGLEQEANRRGIGYLGDRLERYGVASIRRREQASYIRELLPGADGEEAERRELLKLADALERCGDYLGFRHYFTIDELRLHVGYFCQQEKLCGLCALRRMSKVLRAYSEKFHQLLTERPKLLGCMTTLTVVDGADLGERLRHLVNAHAEALERRKRYLRDPGRRPWSEFARAAGGVSRIEIKRGKGSGQWHPHIHSAWLVEQLPDVERIREEWQEITGDSFQVDVRPLHSLGAGTAISAESIAGDLVEVLKYAVKLSDTSVGDAYHIHATTKGKKLIRPFGILHGVKLPDGCLDDPLTDTDLPYIELFFRLVAGRYQREHQKSDSHFD